MKGKFLAYICSALALVDILSRIQCNYSNRLISRSLHSVCGVMLSETSHISHDKLNCVSSALRAPRPFDEH